MEEKWIRWNPIENLNESYYVESISDINDYFEVILISHNNHNKKLQLKFEGIVEAYCITPTISRHQTLQELIKQYDNHFYLHGSFFIIENSFYLQWLSEQSYGLSNHYKLVHYCIVSTNYIIDIANNFEPMVRFLSN